MNLQFKVDLKLYELFCLALILNFSQTYTQQKPIKTQNSVWDFLSVYLEYYPRSQPTIDLAICFLDDHIFLLNPKTNGMYENAYLTNLILLNPLFNLSIPITLYWCVKTISIYTPGQIFL